MWQTDTERSEELEQMGLEHSDVLVPIYFQRTRLRQLMNYIYRTFLHIGRWVTHSSFDPELFLIIQNPIKIFFTFWIVTAELSGLTPFVIVDTFSSVLAIFSPAFSAKIVWHYLSSSRIKAKVQRLSQNSVWTLEFNRPPTPIDLLKEVKLKVYSRANKKGGPGRPLPHMHSLAYLYVWVNAIPTELDIIEHNV